MILNEYIRGDIRLNKKSYTSTIITIFLAVLVISTFVFATSSYYKSYRDLIGNNTGAYHFRIVDSISAKDARSLQSNRYIKKLGLFNVKTLDQAFGSKEKTMFFKMDDNSLSTIESWIKEGSLPKTNEIMISNDMSKETNKHINDFLELDGETYKISAIYYDITYEYDEMYNVYLNIDQEKLLETEKELSPFIWYKNIFNTYSLSEEIMDNLDTKNVTYNYNSLYLDRSFVFDPDDSLLKDHTFQIIVIVLFIILLLLFYSIITNLFLVQESKSIQEYSKLKAIGARKKDINKIIKLKTIYISQLPIILGIISSIALVNLLFFIINRVELYFSKSKDILANTLHLRFNSNLKFIVFIYLLSIIIIYLGTKKPIKKLNKNSILDGLKGNIKSKSYKKYDLVATGNIEKNLAKQFYKNSRKGFITSGITLKLGFVLMSFIMIVITYSNMEDKFNSVNKYTSYNIQGRYATLNPLNKDMIQNIKSLKLDDFINFRHEFVYIDYDENFVDDNFRTSGSLDNLKEEISSLDHMRLNIIGVEDDKFNKLLSKKGFDPSLFKGNKVLFLNSLGDRFDLPISQMTEKPFLKDDVKTLSLSEYGPVLQTRGYEFSLNIEDKIDMPLFDYPLKKNRLNCYMSKTEYTKLFNDFEKIADLDQFEYIAVNSKNVEIDQEAIDSISLSYFNDRDFELNSKIDEENLSKKKNAIGSILAIFFSIFFIVVGFSNSYFAFYNLFIKRKKELELYKAIGMDSRLLDRVLKRERNKILFSFLSSMPLILVLLSFIVSSSSKAFTTMDILSNINYILILGYILLIYLSISKMYNSYRKEYL